MLYTILLHVICCSYSRKNCIYIYHMAVECFQIREKDYCKRLSQLLLSAEPAQKLLGN